MKEINTKIEEIISNPKNLNQEKLQDLLKEVFSIFNELATEVSSPDHEKRVKALEKAMTLKELLNKHVVQLCESFGLNPELVSEQLNNPAHFSAETWEFLSKTKQEINNYQKELENKLSIEPVQKPEKKKVIKTRKQHWLAS